MGMALIGESNNGKTEILKRFIQGHQTQRFDDRVNVRVLDIEAPPIPHLGHLYSKILNRIGDPAAEKGTVGLRLERLLILLDRLKVEILIVDEIHNVLTGSGKQKKAFLNMLKHISNELKCPVVIAGTDKVQEVIGSDFQVQSRFPTFELPLWEPNEDLAKFLVRLEATLPLKNESKLWNLTPDIYDLSGGVIGNVVKIIRRAAFDSIVSGEEQITLKGLKRSAEKVTKPSGFANTTSNQNP